MRRYPAAGNAIGGPPINRVAGAASASLLVVMLVALVGVVPTDASSTGRKWRAPVGNGWPTQDAGANGVASIELHWTGRGTLTLELKNLVRNTVYGVTLFKGPFIAAGSSWSSRGPICADLSDGPVVRLPAIRTTATGTIVKSIALSAGQMRAINAIPRKIAITVGTGRLARCGGFQLVDASGRGTAPPPSPSPTVEPYLPRSTVCSPWPSAIADILAVLSTPDGLCLVRYSSLAEAPAFMDRFDGLYFSSPPTILYVARAATSETATLAHEVCHAHQDRVTREELATDLGMGWYRTLAGTDYLRLTGWTHQGDGWVLKPDPTSKRPEGASNGTSPLEDNAWICAMWFNPALGPRYLRRWAPIRFEWAQRWLPLPPFVVPWQGASD